MQLTLLLLQFIPILRITLIIIPRTITIRLSFRIRLRIARLLLIPIIIPPATFRRSNSNRLRLLHNSIHALCRIFRFAVVDCRIIIREGGVAGVWGAFADACRFVGVGCGSAGSLGEAG